MFGKKREAAITVSFTAEEVLALSLALARDAMSGIGVLTSPDQHRVLARVCEKLRDAARAAKEES